MARVFSGIQPSGELHIGNYLGAVRRWVELQREHECFFCIVDYHAITQEYKVAAMESQTLDMAIGLLAAGIDPERAVLFVQSHVPEHTELSWVLTTVTPVGELERMTQFKEKAQRQESVLAGLMNYPVLQAADVLLYKATLVPVGEDQVQHIELMREIARKFNARYGAGFFPEPQALVGQARRILGLDGESKMSKSMGNTIGVLEEPESIWQRLRPAKTDPARVTRNDPGNPEVCNIYTLHRYFSDPETQEHVARQCRTAGWGCLDCKKVLADNMARELAPMRERAAELRGKIHEVREILAVGAAKAREVARETMQEVRERLGLLQPIRAEEFTR
ncbi:MAG: tryptophan--tRNA ligase [Gemmatimonadales bacterium]|nr:Tryptophan--tRNA ligase [bacterium HR33]GIW51645.1 MAG: tryptophan--tRNA ligase [Gemmatimonadales bacterium]